MVWVLVACLCLGAGGWPGCAIGVAGILGVWGWWRRSGVAACAALLATLCTAVAFGAALRHEDDVRCVTAAVERAAGRRMELHGWVADYPRTSPYGVSFDFSTSLDGRPIRLLVRASFFDVDFGDRYVLLARVSAPADSQRSFLDARGLAGVARVGLKDARRLDGVEGPALTRRVLWPLHRAARVHIARAMGADAGLANGILLGERGSLDRTMQAAVTRLGIAHLIAISGMHLTTVAACVLAVARLTPRWSGWLVLGAVSLYTGAVGSVDSLTRAYAMSVLVFAARALVRPVRLVDVLGKAFWLMLLASPLAVRSVGLQLSVAATFAVLLVLPRLAPRESVAPRLTRLARSIRRSVVGAFVLSAAVEVFIAPLQLHNFGAVSPVGPLATVVFLLPVSVVMVGAFAVAALGGVPVVGAAVVGVLGPASDATCSLAVVLASIAPDPVRLATPNFALYYGGVTLLWAARSRPGWPLVGLGMLGVSFVTGGGA